VEEILASGLIPEFQVQTWAEVLAHELNHRPCCVSRALAI
jgi:hypothetical protein